MRKRLFIYCEGQTEEMIVERLIRNHLGHHGLATHPSARLASAIVGYENLKASNAYHVLANAGIEEGGIVRSKCPRFDTWLKHWENWGNER